MFEVELTVDRHKLRATGNMTKFYPAITSGPADRWAPAEGGELEDVEVFLVRGKRERRLPEKMVDRLDLADDIYTALERDQ